MGKIYTALGLMSGTSLDGIDASIISSDGDKNVEILDNEFVSYPYKFREKLTKYIKKISSKEDITKSFSEYKDIEKELTKLHFQISSKIIQKIGARLS